MSTAVLEDRLPVEGHLCPDDGTQLYWPKNGDVVRSFTCPTDRSDRHCTTCGVIDGAAWMSGSCSECYRRISAELAEEKRERHDNSVRGWAIDDAVKAAEVAELPEVASWLRLYREGMKS